MFDNDIVTLIKQNGKRYESIRANVQPKIIFIKDLSHPVEEGDKIIRVLKNDLSEIFKELCLCKF